MEVKGWKYYNHAAVPTTAPHEEVDTGAIENGHVWKIGGTPLLARWTTDFDCGYETNWWYVIKDEPFDIDSLKSKRRYEIKKGIKNFVVKEINSSECAEDIYNVAIAAYATYPKSYRPNVSHDIFLDGVIKWKFYKVYGAYSIEDNSLCGYACLRKNDSYIDFSMMKAIPSKEKLGVNAAMVWKIMECHGGFLQSGGYICDGARSINHKTHFQDYLEKYFGFRKAYCHLNIKYNPKVGWLIKLLYQFRELFLKLDGIGIVHSINAVMKMEKIVRND